MWLSPLIALVCAADAHISSTSVLTALLGPQIGGFLPQQQNETQCRSESDGHEIEFHFVRGEIPPPALPNGASFSAHSRALAGSPRSCTSHCLCPATHSAATPASLQPFLVRHRSRHLANLTHVKLTLRAKHVITWIPILLASISLATLPRVVVYILGLHYFRSVLGLPHCRGKFLESYRTAVVNF